MSAAALGLVVLACGGPAPGSPLASGNKPMVALQAPANGVQVAVGSTVAVSGTASDSVGVNSVVLFADNVSVANLPAGQPTQSLPFNLNWTATVPGSHTLQVFAYRADGTPSDPAVVQVMVGGVGSGGELPTSLASVPVVTFAPGASTKPTKRPRQSRQPSLQPTLPPEQPSLPPSNPPTALPTLPQTPTPIPVITIPPGGLAPDDTAFEPHLITLSDCSVQVCPVGVLAMGSITEQISAPGGDIKDQLYFVPQASKSYKIELTSCSDVSDGTVWKPTLSTDTMVTGCGDWSSSSSPRRRRPRA